MSHEIRSPLNSLLGYLHIMKRELAGPLPEAYRAQLDRVEQIGSHLRTIVNDLLDQTRLESGHFPVRQSRARLGDAVEGAVTMVEPHARAKGLELSNLVAAYGAEVTFFGDEDRVRQIVVNVLTNAIKFTPAGGTVKISAGSAETPSPDAALTGPGPWVYIRVEDDGAGIAPDRLAAIFEPFEQGALESAPANEGSGLGLSISRRLARLMGGDLTVRSQVGRGSTFFLWLPGGETAALPPGVGPAAGAR